MNGMKQEENHRSLLGYKTARWCTHGDLTALALLGIQVSNGDMIAYIYISVIPQYITYFCEKL